MPRMGFELTIPAFQQAKTDYALDLAAIVIDTNWYDSQNKQKLLSRKTLPYCLLECISCEAETEF
jgi:hypothetical protein